MQERVNSLLRGWLGRFGRNFYFFALLWISTLSPAQLSLFDPSFSVGPGADGTVNTIVLQNDGRILVGGDFNTICGMTNPHLARLNSDGQFDSTFGPGTDGQVYRLLQQPDGKILVTGEFTNLQGVVRHGIGRLLTSGLVDAEFDAGAFFQTNDTTFALGLQADGKVLVGSFSSSGFFPHGSLFRLDTNGQPDSSFIQTNTFDNYWTFSMHDRTNGSILVGGGFSSVNGFPSPGLALIDSNGRLDANFNSHLENYSTVLSIVEQTNGNLLIGGLLKIQGNSNSVTLARLTPELEWDTKFSTDSFKFDSPAGTFIRSVVEQPDGKIVIAGSFYEVGGYWRRHIARLDSQGHVDPCFDPGLGLGGFEGAHALVRLDDGRILVGGNFDSIQAGSPNNLARLMPQSDCDTTRVYLIRNEDNSFYAIGTCAPGGTNFLQASSNLVNWVDVDVQTQPYLFRYQQFDPGFPITYYRVKKIY